MSQIKLTIYKILAGLFKKKSSGYKVLMYHSIAYNPSHREYYTVSLDDFYEQMKYVAYNYRCISLSALSMNNQSGVLVTFDDGYRDNLLNAVPIMEKFGIPYTIFITTNKIGTVDGDIEFLSANDIFELSKSSLCTIGSHGHTHRPLGTLSKSELYKELKISKKILEDIIGKKVFCISYPHGSFNKLMLKIISEIGFTHGATSRFGGNINSFNFLELKRIDIWGFDTLDIFREKVEGGWDWLVIRERVFPLVWLYRFIMRKIKF